MIGSSLLLGLLAATTRGEDRTDPKPERAAQQSGTEDLERRVHELELELQRLRSEGIGNERVRELERRIDLLASEIEKMRTGGATEVEAPEGQRGFGPAASKVYRVERGVSIGGYGEMLYQNFAREREDGVRSGETDQIDLLRAILYVGYKFGDRIHFNSEIEFEHASTEGEGAVSVEFAYVDFSIAPELGIRGGMLLVPVGFLNELHEPPIFYGARRPEVETRILPSTWSENGVGLFGEKGLFQYRVYAVAGLDAGGFSASGIREGRQGGSESKAADFGLTGRLDVSGLPGLLAGISFYTGNSGQGEEVRGQSLGARVSLFDLHAQYRGRGLYLRGLYGRGSVGDAALVNLANGLEGDRSVGKDQFGWYVEAAYDLMSLSPGGEGAIAPYLRYEKLDTQQSVPAGYVDDPATERKIVTFGIDVKPIPRIVLKADYQRVRTGARTGVNQFNLALGYLF